MNTHEKKERIKSFVSEMLEYSHKNMLLKLDTVMNSGCIDIDSWDEKISPMILPKTIVTALLEHESVQYLGKGTSHEKTIKKEVKNIRYFI